MVIQLEVHSLARPKGYRFAYSVGSKTITEAIQSLDPEAEVQTHPKSKQVTVKTEASESSVMEVLDAAGYRATPAKPFFYDL